MEPVLAIPLRCRKCGKTEIFEYLWGDVENVGNVTEINMKRKGWDPKKYLCLECAQEEVDHD